MQRIFAVILLVLSYGYSNQALSADELDSLNTVELGLAEFDLPDFDGFSVPVVLTATRIQQHQSDVPASVTILDAEFISQLSTNNLADVLRFVPGIMVGPDRNNNVDSLNYHGGPSSLPKNFSLSFLFSLNLSFILFLNSWSLISKILLVGKTSLIFFNS